MASCERINNNFDKGRTIFEKLEAARKVTAGVLVGTGTHRVGNDVKMVVSRKRKKRNDKDAKKK